jgi:hypothetical protein
MAKNLDGRIKQLESKDDQAKAEPVINTNISAAEWERSLAALAAALGVDLQQGRAWMEANNG